MDRKVLGLIKRTTVALMGMMFLNACEVNYIFYNVFDISCYVHIHASLYDKTEYFVLATCIINKDCEAEKFCDISTGECKWREGEEGNYFAL